MSADSRRSSEGALFGRSVWRFAQLLAVGFAWAVPLLPAVSAGFGLGTYSHPRVAHLYFHHGWQLLVTMLALACLGIALIAALMRRPTQRHLVWLLVPVSVVLVGVAPFVAPGRSYAACLALSLAATIVPLLIVALGAAVTTATFWRGSRWLGIAWLACWLCGITFVAYSTAETADSGGPADGLIILPLVTVLIAVVLFAAVLASTLRGISDWMEHARNI